MQTRLAWFETIAAISDSIAGTARRWYARTDKYVISKPLAGAGLVLHPGRKCSPGVSEYSSLSVSGHNSPSVSSEYRSPSVSEYSRIAPTFLPVGAGSGRLPGTTLAGIVRDSRRCRLHRSLNGRHLLRSNVSRLHLTVAASPVRPAVWMLPRR